MKSIVSFARGRISDYVYQLIFTLPWRDPYHRRCPYFSLPLFALFLLFQIILIFLIVTISAVTSIPLYSHGVVFGRPRPLMTPVSPVFGMGLPVYRGHRRRPAYYAADTSIMNTGTTRVVAPLSTGGEYVSNYGVADDMVMGGDMVLG